MPLSSFAFAGRYPAIYAFAGRCPCRALPWQADTHVEPHALNRQRLSRHLARYMHVFFLKPCCKLVVHEAQKWWLWLHKLSMEAPDDLAKLCRVSTGV